MRKGQALLESSSMYVYALLIVIITIAGLTYFGVFDNQTPQRCEFSDSIHCDSFQIVQVSNDTYYFDVYLENPGTNALYVSELEIKEEGANSYCVASSISTISGDTTDGKLLPYGAGATLRFSLKNNSNCSLQQSGLTLNSKKFDVQLAYKNNPSELPLIAGGKITADIQGVENLKTSCEQALVHCDESCPYAKGGAGSCYLDTACLYECPDLGADETVYRLNLETGMNFISAPVQPENTSLKNVFQPLISSGKLIRVQDQDGTVLQGPDWDDGGKEWDYHQAYKVDVMEPVEFIIVGTDYYGSNGINLRSGVNYVAAQQPMSLIDAFHDPLMRNTLRYVRDANGNEFNRSTGWNNTIGPLQVENGYEVYVEAPMSLLWEPTSFEYQLLPLQSGINYRVSTIEVLLSFEEITSGIMDSFVSIRDPITGDEFYYVEDEPIYDLEELLPQQSFIITVTNPVDILLIGQDTREYYYYMLNGSDTTTYYIGMPPQHTLDPFTALSNLVELDALVTITDENNNQVYHDGSTWVNEIGNLIGSHHYIVEINSSYIEEYVVFEEGGCRPSLSCTLSCGAELGYSDGEECFMDTYCETPCYDCVPDSSCDSVCSGTGYSRDGGSCFTSSSCVTACTTCESDASCCGGDGYRDTSDGLCYQDSLCSNSICQYSQTITINDPSGEQYVSIAVEPSTRNTYDLFSPLFDDEIVAEISDRFGNILFPDGSIVPGPYSTMGGAEIEEVRTYEGYILHLNELGGGVAWNGPAMVPEYSLSGENVMQLIPETENIIGVPYGLSEYRAMTLLESLLDPSLLEYVEDSSGNRIEYIVGVGWSDEIGYFTPGEAYKMVVTDEVSWEIPS